MFGVASSIFQPLLQSKEHINIQVYLDYLQFRYMNFFVCQTLDEVSMGNWTYTIYRIPLFLLSVSTNIYTLFRIPLYPLSGSTLCPV
ncbi:hypothetical protein CEXT_643551 [Caerostris extrusa]|uniref:Uncharacterized protein n=1 Tax=Caerostris extrusa TaxID=172846 RepID=A0AAV4VM41_CAEEX|nr:hypothetical protein CEXT_643551 [Caerostris extrusa]